MAGLETELRSRLSARFYAAADGSVRSQVSAEPPLELRGPFAGSRAPVYHLRNTTAGVLKGDALELDVTVEAGAAVRVASSSATKVFAAGEGESSLGVSLRVERGGLLLWGPQATILHACASYRQEITVSHARGGRAVVGEVLVMGRLARGERFEFERFENVFDLTIGECAPAYSEAYVLTPGASLQASMAERGVVASIYALGFEAAALAQQIEGALREEPLAGWSELPNGAGLVVRGLAESLSQAERLVHQVMSIIASAAAPRSSHA